MKSNIICLISKLLYPNYDPFCFLFYMYFKYYSIVKRQRKYLAETLPDNVLWNLIRNHPESNYDINNCVIVHPENLYPGDKILPLYHYTSRALRYAMVLPEGFCEKDKLYISNTYLHNYLLGTTNLEVKFVTSSTQIEFAQEIELSLIVTPYEVNNTIIDLVVEGYFKLPKLVRKGDAISVNIKYFSRASMDYKLNLVENLYFKCNKVMFRGKEVTEEHFCAIGQTLIKQAANIQSFLPRQIEVTYSSLVREVKPYYNVNMCPYGLERYLELLKLAIDPFLCSCELKLRPIFLLEGQQGCGYDILINSLASYLGMHYFKTNSCEFSANIYAQSESKLHNLFFAAKMSAPCIISIHKFENCGKNAEGQYDQRLISSFISCLNNLFSGNKFPIIVFCCNNSQEIPPEFKRLFLEIFYIQAPTAFEREQILIWLMDKNNITLRNVELVGVSNKTHGFYFEDLKASVYHAENHFRKRFAVMDKVILEVEDFDAAIDSMQFNYNESLGAARVPRVQWSDVGGLNDIKHQIIETINLPLRHPDVFKHSGLTRSGILLFGPPGTGKTLIAKAVATECSLCFLTVKGPELLNMYVGQSERNVREVFERARQASPCIIFFDELDSLAPNRGISGDSGGVTDRVVSQLLAEMDGLKITRKVFIIGATNRPDLIDPALLRPGRFDKLLYIGPCIDTDSKTTVFQALTRKFKLAEEVDMEKLVAKCPQNISGADLYGICSDAWTSAAKTLIEKIENSEFSSNDVSHRDVTVNVEDFIEAISNIKPSISEADLNYFEHLKKELTSRGGY